MSHNTFGHVFRVTTWGESHGPAIGCVIDGCPPNIPLSESDIQFWLDRRRPSQSRFTTQRKESDKIKILSGVFEGITTGTPLSFLIDNVDIRTKDYEGIRKKFRPGHADYTYKMKYGVRDYRGGGRQSARETANRVAAGAVARKILGNSISIRGALIEIGGKKINPDNWDWNEVENNPFWCPDKITAEKWANYLDKVRKAGSSVGAVIEITASGVPVGFGAPIYAKLDSDIAAGLMSINAVKGVEIGAGFAAAKKTGQENSDEMRIEGKDVKFLSNNAGGIIGGISTGQDIVARFAVKPTSSILQPLQTINEDKENDEIITTGRHDPCVGIRAVPVGEAMVSCVLADHLLRHRAQIS